jgi:hypothetical protein
LTADPDSWEIMPVQRSENKKTTIDDMAGSLKR